MDWRTALKNEGFLEPKIRYIRVNDENVTPVGCIAHSRFKESKKVYVGISYCAPFDVWNKEVAKEIAIGRCLKIAASDLGIMRSRINPMVFCCTQDEYHWFLDRLKDSADNLCNRDYLMHLLKTTIASFEKPLRTGVVAATIEAIAVC